VLAALDAEQDLVALSVPVCEAVFPGAARSAASFGRALGVILADHEERGREGLTNHKARNVRLRSARSGQTRRMSEPHDHEAERGRDEHPLESPEALREPRDDDDDEQQDRAPQPGLTPGLDDDS
jgi:hypothetical protein